MLQKALLLCILLSSALLHPYMLGSRPEQEKLCIRQQDAYLLLCFLLGSTRLISQGLGSCFLKLPVLCLRRPVSQFLVGVHMPHAPPTEVSTGIKVVCQGSTACSRAKHS